MQGTKWVVFEANGEALWSQVRLSIGTFLHGLFLQGAFYGQYVKCDGTTTTQSDVDNGILNIQIGIAPVRPAEFVVIQISQLTQPCKDC